MQRIPVLLLLLSSFVVLPAWGQPFFLVYAAPGGQPACTLGIDPALLQGGDPTVHPVLPPIDVPIGQNRTLDLCFIVWPAASSSAGEVVCSDGTGSESCAEQLIFATNGGIQVLAFTPAPPTGVDGFPKYEASLSPNGLRVMGGHPLQGRNGSGLVGLRLGSVVLKGVSPAGTFELSGGQWVTADMQSLVPQDAVVATTVNTCGNGVLQPGEECEDGNLLFGDGCAPSCRVESDFTLQGVMGPLGSTGTLAVEIDGIGVSLDLATLPGAPADEVIFALVTAVEDEPAIGSTAVQRDDPAQPGGNDGRRFVTDGDITDGPTLMATNGSIAVPEPSLAPGLAAGIVLLALLGRRRGVAARA